MHYVEDAVVNSIPYADISKRLYMGEDVHNIDYAIETAITLLGCNTVKGLGHKAATKFASTFARKMETQKKLLVGEGKVGKFRELDACGKKGDNITPNHMPQASHMEKHGVSYQEGIAMMMEHPFPGTGGRHRQTYTYGRQADSALSTREALARDIFDVRSIYNNEGVYTDEIRESLQRVISENKQSFPKLFMKKQKGM